jgi:hypothetical protein
MAIQATGQNTSAGVPSSGVNKMRMEIKMKEQRTPLQQRSIRHKG